MIELHCLCCKRSVDFRRADFPDVPAWVARIEHDKCNLCDDGDFSAEHWIDANGDEPDPLTGMRHDLTPTKGQDNGYRGQAKERKDTRMTIKEQLEQSTYRKSDARIVEKRKRVLEDGPIVEGEWQPIERAPYDTPVRIKAGQMSFLARLRPNHSMSDLDTACDQWVAEIEGEHPPCWSGGACWDSNEDEVCSLQPEAWARIGSAKRGSD